MYRRLAVSIVTAALAATGVFASPAFAETCTVSLVNGPAGSVQTCTAFARGFVVVTALGVTHVVATCDGRPYYDSIVGMVPVSGFPGPCTIVLTVTANTPATFVGGTV